MSEEQVDELQQSHLSKAEEGGGWVSLDDKPNDEDPSLLTFTESSFLSGPNTEEISTAQTRNLLSKLQEKLEKDRNKYSEKAKNLQMKLVNARSGYEKDLWKCKLDKNQLERTFRLETNELKLNFDKLSLSQTRDKALIDDLNAKITQLNDQFQAEIEAKTLLQTRFNELKTAYETSLATLHSQSSRLLQELEEIQRENQKFSEEIARKNTEIGEKDTKVFQLEQEINRLKAIPVVKCRHEEEISRLKIEIDREINAKNQLNETFDRKEKEILAQFAEKTRKIDQERGNERNEYEKAISELRNELIQSKKAAIQSINITEQLNLRRPRDLSSELSEITAENVNLVTELKEIRVKNVELEQKYREICEEMEKKRDLERELAVLKKGNKEILTVLREEREKNGYLEAEMAVNVEVMKTLRDSVSNGAEKTQEMELKTALETIETLKLALNESESNCESLETEAQMLISRFTEEKEDWESEQKHQEDYISSLLMEIKTLKLELDAVKAEKEESERILTETVAKLPQQKHGDLIDSLLKEYMQKQGMKNPFVRLAEGLYTFGNKKVSVTVKNGAIIVRVGGGYMFLEEFLRTYLPKESEKKVQLVIEPHARSNSVGNGFKRTFTLMLDGRQDSFPPPQHSTDSPPKSFRSIHESSPTLYQPTVSSQNKAISSPPASTTTVFRAFQLKKQ